MKTKIKAQHAMIAKPPPKSFDKEMFDDPLRLGETLEYIDTEMANYPEEQQRAITKLYKRTRAKYCKRIFKLEKNAAMEVLRSTK